MSTEYDQNKNVELLPCPYCGSSALSITSAAPESKWIRCLDCNAEGPWGGTEPEATWNRRAAASCASKWLPIESAPDQKWILGWLVDYGCVVVKRVKPDGRGGEHGDFVWATPESPDAGFWAEQLVTHYQLLPSGPTPPNGDVRG